jgi:hypothetical protein
MSRTNESRLGERKNLLVTAELRWGQNSISVRIRNLSGVGALIEGDYLPAANIRLVLARGRRSAEGELVWIKSGKAGLAFVEPINPTEWLPIHSKVRADDDLTALAQLSSENKPLPTLCADRDHHVHHNLIRIRALVEEARLQISFQSDDPERRRSAIEKLRTIDRLLGWQVDELQPKEPNS